MAFFTSWNTSLIFSESLLRVRCVQLRTANVSGGSIPDSQPDRKIDLESNSLQAVSHQVFKLLSVKDSFDARHVAIHRSLDAESVDGLKQMSVRSKL